MRISWPERRQRTVQPSRLSLSDLAAESLAGILQRPGRSALTMFGTVLGIGTFVAVLGLSATANGQIGKQFTVLDATQVTVTDSGAAHATTPVIDFPAAADADAQRIHGVIAAGVWWEVGSGPPTSRGYQARVPRPASSCPSTRRRPDCCARAGQSWARACSTAVSTNPVISRSRS
jgi:hypothetical protein